ncbi:DUF167 domain-containing protein [soil metagenome]
MTLTIRDHAEGATLPVKAKPGAKRATVLGEHAGALKIAVTAPPEDGKANDAILTFLGELLGLHHSELALLSGRSSRDKVILIRGRTAIELQTMLAHLETP